MSDTQNIDTLFANCTNEELEFDAIFDNDDSIIDMIAGVDESGIPFTGPNFNWDEFDKIVEAADDMVGENPDFEYQNDGDASGSEKDAEGTKNVDPEIGGEVGDGKEVSGKENSAESNADDTTDEEKAIGMDDKQQTSLESVDADILAMLEADENVNDEDEREGKETDTKNVEGEKQEVLGAALESNEEEPEEDKTESEDESCKESVDADILAMLEADEADVNGEEPESSNPEDNTSEDVVEESIDADILAMLEADENVNDEDEREGKETDTKNVEGEKQEVLGAALESSEEEPEEDDSIEESIDADILAMLDEDAAEGPIEDDDVAEREGEVSDTTVETEAAEDKDVCPECGKNPCECAAVKEMVDTLLANLEGCDALCDDDAAERDGKCTDTSNVEGEKQEVLGDANKGENKEDPIEDPECPNDGDVRAGADSGVDDTEGVSTKVVGAALESTDDFIDDVLDKLNGEFADSLVADVETDNLVSDNIVQDLTDNADINVKESAESDDFVEDDIDDEDIEAIDSESETDNDTSIEYDYSDDELIDAIINGEVDE